MTGDRTLRLDVAYCALAALLLLTFARPLAPLTGLPATALAAAGLGVLAWTALLAYLTAVAPRRLALRIVLAVNVVATLAIAITAATSHDTLLTFLLAAVAAEVAAFAVTQALALRTLQPTAR
ncbi:hypothetical protein [Kribbella speibonae]|uniref:Integral membrane protein n=1 Tax=Kribbella speibonae TaxID=1572660 RepID=A0ABY2AHX6_9ACTN|nr:hypothetical protein [Kribbella speibonae]TCC28066.1 hypothetical protein E0H58_09115 [Kribbella speibonae]